MTRLTVLSAALGAAVCLPIGSDLARGQSLPQGSGQRPASEPALDFRTPDVADAESASADPEPIDVPSSDATIVFGGESGSWLPDASTPGGWLPELEPPAGQIDCTSGGQLPGPRRRVWRSFVRPTDPSIDQRCVVCVKEPYLEYETVEETQHVVVHRCFETSECFKHAGCEGGRWYEAKGTTKLRKLHPCEAKAKLKYRKPVVRYRDVYYYIECDHSETAGA